jgi:hypothetical protein
MSKVIANYNMEFDNGTFKKDRLYPYYQKDNMFIVTTEENKEQSFFDFEFGMFFSLLKI